MKRIVGVFFLVAILVVARPRGDVRGEGAAVIQFVFTSDAHYGITRPAFRGHKNVAATVVNRAMVKTINALPGLRFPEDGGLRGGQAIGPIDFVVEGGDIANREEGTGPVAIQPASASWSQFLADYAHGLALVDRTGKSSELFVVPGNHEASNVVGFYRSMTPPTDAGPYAAIYNLMMRPAMPRSAGTIDYRRDKVLTSRNVGGIHFQFITLWPDSAVRAWMESDLRGVAASTSVVVFAHDQPEVEAKHFTNPNGAHDINATDRFENLLGDPFVSGTTTGTPSVQEQRLLERFLGRHRNVTAYFHGNSNWNQFYDWVGPDGSARLHVFRVDSPMKGAFSAADETRLSFQMAVLDPETRRLTVREVLWNLKPRANGVSAGWGGSVTVALDPRP